MRQFGVKCLFLGTIILAALPGRAADSTANATCSFQDGKQMSVRYEQTTANANLSSSKTWAPGKQPMVLFTQSELAAGDSDVPAGAYSMYIRGGKDSWKLILNKNVAQGSKYDEHQDLAHIDMPLAQLSQAQKQFTVTFAQIGPKQCNLRIYDGTVGTWAEFHEK